MMAKMYEKGEYVEKSFHKAFEFYKVAAENNSTALYMVGDYAENKISEEIKEYGDNNEMALKFYTESAEKKNSDAFVRLGKIYEHGLLSLEADYDLAVKNYKCSIELDENPEGLNCLGSLYYRGKSLKQNFTLAFEYFLKAANLGNSDAMNSTGICYEYGKGTMNNYDKALK
jgi:TPR repeat protein